MPKHIAHLGVVVTVFNQSLYTSKFLHSLINHVVVNCDAIHVIVVDNASTDDTADVIKNAMETYLALPALFKKDTLHVKLDIRYIRNNDNRGYGAGANVGINYLHSNYMLDGDYLICNNDIEFYNGCIDNLIEDAYSNDNYGIVGGKLQFPDGMIQHGGAFLNVYGWGQHKHTGENAHSVIPVDKISEEEYCTGALLYVKGELVNKLIEKDGSVFDEQFYMFFEEVDLCYRTRELGYKVIYSPRAEAIHYEGRS
jgi:GT2 family glycosyltransferase